MGDAQGCGSSGLAGRGDRVLNIRTSFVYPPIPIRQFDWSAVDDDTYDGADDSHCPIGHGATEQEAIDDLMQQIEDAAT